MKIGLIQFPVDENQNESSFSLKVATFCQKAADENVDLLVFPELASLDLVNFRDSLHGQWPMVAQICQNTQRKLLDFSSQNKMAILAPSHPLYDGERIFNSCVFIENGQVRTRIRKVFLTPEEKSWGWSGGNELVGFNWKGLRTVILVCHDSEFPQISTQLATLKPQLILVPSMTSEIRGMQRVRWCAQARAVEHQCFAAVSAIVPTPATKGDYAGQAAMILPRTSYFDWKKREGKINTEELLVVEIDPSELTKSQTDPETIFPMRDAEAGTLPKLTLI